MFETNALKALYCQEVETKRFQRGVNLMCVNPHRPHRRSFVRRVALPPRFGKRLAADHLESAVCVERVPEKTEGPAAPHDRGGDWAPHAAV